MDIEQMKKDLGGGNVFPIGEENVAFAKYFTGECYLNMLTTERVPVGLVTFAPGTINAYHIHHKGGQILLVTGGRGWYQEEGKPARELKAGDVVNISPEVKHWHGAARDSWFQHLAVEVPAEGASNEWLEFLPEEEYDKLPYQEEGKPAVSLHEGSLVMIPAEVKHWHGAKKDSRFSHIAVEIPGEECRSEWCEPVSDEAYSKL